MLQLRPYQTEALEAIRERFRHGIRRPLVSLPTGTGKTVLFSAMASSALKRGSRVLVLAHRDELLTQAADKMHQFDEALDAMTVGLVKAEVDQHDRPVVVASVQTLGREARLARIAEPFQLIIVDEAHHAAADSYQRILRGLGSFEDDGPLTLGVTATPQRADALSLETTFQEVVYHRDILWAIRSGYLCDLKGRQVRLEALDLTGVKTRGGDYVEGQVAQALEAAEAPYHGARAWVRYAEGRKTIVFTPTIALAHDFAREMRTVAGVNAQALSGETPQDQRRQMLRDFASGDLRVICNAQVLTEGFDEPSVECIMVARPTKSQPLYVQMVGRGTRLHPGKSDCLIIDLVGATDRLDLTTLPRLFGLGDADEERDAVAERGVAEVVAERQAAEVRSGRITAAEVELFKRQKLAWVKLETGQWALTAGDLSLVVRQTPNGLYRVERRPRSGPLAIIGHDLDLGYAQGMAEDAARAADGFAEVLVSKDAGWRSKPASTKQKAALRRFGQVVPQGLTAGEASDLMAAAIARRRAS